MNKIATPEMYKTYKKIRKNILVKSEKDKRILLEDINATFRLLTRYKDKLKDTKWDVDKLQEVFTINVVKHDIKDIKINKLHVKIDETKDFEGLNEHLRYYVNNLINLVRELAEINDTIKILAETKLTVNEFSKLLRTINFEATKDILGKGGKFKIGKQLGDLYIVLIDSSKGKRKTRKIDWGESIKTLKAIGKDNEQAQWIVKAYEDKLISKKEFMHKMKPYVYSEANPKLPKYLVNIENDINPYWHWGRMSCTIKNKTLYSFTPTNFVHNETRSQVDFTNNIKDKNEIINTTLLGCRDKVFALLRYDKSHELYFKS